MEVNLNGEKQQVDLTEGIDISLTLSDDDKNPLAWYVKKPTFEPVRENGWIGSVAEGGAVNFRNIFFNPHGHGTHTECLGHITQEVYSINKVLKKFFFSAKVVTIRPEEIENQGVIDQIITATALAKVLNKNEKYEALIIRTLPNDEAKRSKNYSATNPPYVSVDCLELMNACNIEHLLIDLPSVDREQDGGKLAFHHAFWGVPQQPLMHKTITEFIFVPNYVEDGPYLLNLQVAPFENDAAPSRPVLFRYEK
jgi:kynurenine formamidase